MKDEAILYLIRGLSRSGKTTLAKTLAPNHNYAGDDFFTDAEGNYSFDAQYLGDAHSQCEFRTMMAMKESAPVIAVHNTFSEKWEAEPYFRMAEDHGYRVFVIECQNKFDDNGHNVPAEATEKMLRRWQKHLR